MAEASRDPMLIHQALQATKVEQIPRALSMRGCKSDRYTVVLNTPCAVAIEQMGGSCPGYWSIQCRSVKGKMNSHQWIVRFVSIVWLFCWRYIFSFFTKSASDHFLSANWTPVYWNYSIHFDPMIWVVTSVTPSNEVCLQTVWVKMACWVTYGVTYSNVQRVTGCFCTRGKMGPLDVVLQWRNNPSTGTAKEG